VIKQLRSELHVGRRAVRRLHVYRAVAYTLIGMLSVSGFELFYAARQAGGFASPPTANCVTVGVPAVHGYTA
jgi:hypothetical protein